MVRFFSGACALALLLGASACDQRSGSSPGAEPLSVAAADAAPDGAAQAAEPPAPVQQPVVAAPSASVRATPLVITQAQVAAEHSAGLEKCLGSGDAAKGVTAAMAACINAELDAQDARLNTAYREVMARLDSAGQTRLRNEERAWIRQRDEGCAASATGGTIDRVEIPSCVLDETIRRRLALEVLSS